MLIRAKLHRISSAKFTLRIQYSVRLLLALLTIAAIAMAFADHERKARLRVNKVRAMIAQDATPSEILEMLGNPVRIDFGQSFGHGYYTGLNWNCCLEPSWPFVHVPERTYVLVECKSSVFVNHIWLDHGDDRNLELIFPDHVYIDGGPEYVTIRHY